MATVEDRIVQLSFDNRSFEGAANTTIGTLAKLKQAISFGNSKNGLDDVEASASKFSLNGVLSGVQSLTSKFSALQVVGVTALATLASKAVSSAVEIGKSFTTGPIAAGFTNYETQINAVQTILANTGLTGKKGLDQVNAALANLNTYANQTIYNFSDMAKSIGTFTAAGVKLGPATDAIKGIANLAAASGASADQASGAMYQLSQALSAGVFKLQDYNSVVNAGIGGKLFQTAIYNAAKAAGTLKNVKVNESYDQWTKAGNNFRKSLQEGFVTTKVLTQALSSFTGDQTSAQLKNLGYTKAQILQTQQTARLAVDSATKIKTFSQLTDALKEEVATAYAAIFKTLFGDINQAKSLFSDLHTHIENALTLPLYAFNNLLIDASALGARTNVIKGFTNIVKALGDILKPLKGAFREVFPAETAKEIANITKSFADFTAKLAISKKTSDELKSTFAGVFAILDIGKQVVQGIFTVFATLFGTLTKGSGGILKFTGNIGDMLVAFDKALKSGGQLQIFFSRVAAILADPIQILKTFAAAIGGLFSNFHIGSLTGIVGGLTGVNAKLLLVQKALGGVTNFAQKLVTKVKPAIDEISSLFDKLGHAIANALNSNAFGNLLKGLQTGLLAGILVVLKNFLAGGLGGFHVAVGEGIFGQAKEALDGLTGSLRAMQAELKAKALVEISIAVAALALSLVILANTPADKLNNALKVVAVAMGELLGAFATLSKLTGSEGFLKLPIISLGLISLAGAILILSLAVKLLATLNTQQLQKGLGAIAVLLASLVVATKPLSAASAGMIKSGIGIAAIAVAMNILYFAVKNFGSLDFATLGKGLGSVVVALTGIAAAMRLMPRDIGVQALSIGVIAIALNVLYLAVKNFSSLDYQTLGRGLTGVAGSLAAIALGLRAIPKDIGLQALALVVVSGALLVLGKAISNIGGLSYTVIGKGLGTIGVALGILAIGLNAMDTALPGAAALGVAALALKLIAPALVTLGGLSWGEIAKGLVTLAGALGIFVLAGAAADLAVPGLLALGVASLGIGAGLALAGVGVGLLATGLAALAGVGGAGVAVLVKAFAGLIAEIPAAATALAEGFINVVVLLGKNAPAIVGAIQKILDQLIALVIAEAPKLAVAIGVLITQILTVLVNNAPNIIAAGLKLLEDLLSGISNNIAQVTAQVADIITKFLDALATHIKEIVAAGLNLLVQLLNGIADNISKVTSAAANVIAKFIGGIGDASDKIVSAGAASIIHFVTGLGQNASKIVSAGTAALIKFVDGLTSNAVKLTNAAGAAVLKFLDGLDAAIKKYEPQIIKKSAQIGVDIVSGIISGLGGLVSALVKAVKKKIGNAFSNPLDLIPFVGSPYKVGTGMTDQIVQGINNSSGAITKSLKDNLVDAAHKALSQTNNPLSGIINLQPVIKPVLDLSDVTAKSEQLKKLTTPNNGEQSIKTITSNDNANAISNAQAAAQQVAVDETDATIGDGFVKPQIQFIQNNTSPKALTAIEIYRQTNNQLGQARSVLTNA